MPDTQRQHENNKSSLFEKVPPDLRRQIDIAIVERVPPTYQAVWMNFKLGELGVSFTAFYRYARRLRDRANLAEIANLTADEGADLDACIHKLVARRVLDDLLNDDELPPDEIAALMTGLRQAAKTIIQDRKFTEDSRLAWARLEHDRAELRLKADHVQAIRQRFLGVLDESKARRLADMRDPNPSEAPHRSRHLDDAPNKLTPRPDHNPMPPVAERIPSPCEGEALS